MTSLNAMALPPADAVQTLQVCTLRLTLNTGSMLRFLLNHGPIRGSPSVCSGSQCSRLGELSMLRDGKVFNGPLETRRVTLACGVSFVAWCKSSPMGVDDGRYSPRVHPVDGRPDHHSVSCASTRLLTPFRDLRALVGISTLPYMKSFANDPSRVGLDKTITIANPNDLGAWFGFCSVYFTIAGLETRRNWVRAISWSTAVGCLRSLA